MNSTVKAAIAFWAALMFFGIGFASVLPAELRVGGLIFFAVAAFVAALVSARILTGENNNE